jgi:hypothetical protein
MWGKTKQKIKIKIEGGKDERDVLSLMFFQVKVEISTMNVIDIIRENPKMIVK